MRTVDWWACCKRLTKRKIVPFLGLLSVVCICFYVYFSGDQDITPVDLNTNLNWKLVVKVPNINQSALVKIQNQETYILSAILSAEQQHANNPRVVINVFDSSNDDIFCCILDKQLKLHITESPSHKQHHHYLFWPKVSEIFNPALLPAKQVICPLVPPTEGAAFISLSANFCSTNINQYKPIVRVRDHPGELAICAKVAYNDSLKPAMLVEWIEFQKLMGVDKVLVFTLDIPEDVRKVFDFYANQDFVTTVPYGIAGPLSRSFKHGNRSFPQFYHDEQLAILDCRERLSGYSYVAGIDLDEIIIPKADQTLKELLEATLGNRYPVAGGYYFYQQFHITEWNPSNPENALASMRYLQALPPRWESQKFVYIPRRTDNVRTHEVFVRSPFQTQVIPPEVAVIHHYRKCPRSWVDCHTRGRVYDNTTLRFERQLDETVRTVLLELNKRS